SANSASVAELAIARSTSAVASCRARASASSCSRAASCVFSSTTVETRLRVALVLAFVPLERSLRPPVRLFAPLRDKVTPRSTSRDPSPGHRHLEPNTAGPAVCRLLLGRYFRAGGHRYQLIEPACDSFCLYRLVHCAAAPPSSMMISRRPITRSPRRR